jgi:ferric-dicitrate binding protein FerR (iron transport regulator)
VAELFNRQNRLQLRIGDSATGALRITGLVWSDDPEGFVRLLESGFNVTAERSGDVVHLRQTL